MRQLDELLAKESEKITELRGKSCELFFLFYITMHPAIQSPCYYDHFILAILLRFRILDILFYLM